MAGQHRFEAAKRWRARCSAKGVPVPEWAITFPCEILGSGLSVDELEEIAGRLQAQATIVKKMSPTDTLDFFYRLLQRHPDWSRSTLLAATYKRTGKTAADGTMVCYCQSTSCI